MSDDSPEIPTETRVQTAEHEASVARLIALAPRKRPHPAPETPEPSMDELSDWMDDGMAEATDGCEVEPDGMCEHGHPSWLLHLGLI